jgi:hypothetical protein
MARAEDTQAIVDACAALGPLTLTEAGHAARISRWRAYVAIRAGVNAQPDPLLVWTRVGPFWKVDAAGTPDAGGQSGHGHGHHPHGHPHHHHDANCEG